VCEMLTQCVTLPHDVHNSFSETNLLVREGEISQASVFGIEW